MNGIQEVSGSIPLISTKMMNHKVNALWFFISSLFEVGHSKTSSKLNNPINQAGVLNAFFKTPAFLFPYTFCPDNIFSASTHHYIAALPVTVRAAKSI